MRKMKRLFTALAALGLSAIMLSAQDFNAAVEAFNAGAQALETSKTEALAQFRAALEQASACEGEEAEELVGKCKEAITSTLISVAKEQINDANYDEALITLSEAKTLAAEYENESAAASVSELVPNVYLRKGSVQLKDKDFAGAAASFKEVVALNPEDAQANLLLGQALLQGGNTDDAIVSLTKANELGSPQAPKALSSAYLRQGQAFAKAGKNADAVTAYEKSIEVAPSANAYKLLAGTYTKLGKNSAAIDAYKKYLELEPKAKDAADVIYTIAATAEKAGNKATAKEYYQKLSGTKYAEQAAARLKLL